MKRDLSQTRTTNYLSSRAIYHWILVRAVRSRAESKGDKMEVVESYDWSKLPANLRYLETPAKKYGHFQFDDRIYDYFKRDMTKSDVAEIIELAKKTEKDS